MSDDLQTRHSRVLPELRFSLNLLYVGRFLLGMNQIAATDLDAFDERIEDVTDELIATELLHEAAMLAGDVLPDNLPPSAAQADAT
jgi:hypothetical protein